MVAVLRRAWRPRVLSTAQPNFGSSSSTSGTIRSNTYTSTPDSIGEQPRDFHLLSTMVEEEELDEERAEEELEENRVKKLVHIKGLVMEFCGGSGNSDLGAQERWFSELNVDWIFHLADGDASTEGTSGILISRQLQHLTRSWILALLEISRSIHRCFDGWYSQEEAIVWAPAYNEFQRFVKAVLLMMLPFADAIVALNVLNDPSSEHQIVSSNVPGAVDKLQATIEVRDALSTASQQILLSFSSSPYYLRSTTTIGDMKDLLSAELDKLDEAILETVDKIRTGIMSMTTDDSFSTPQRSPDIHNVTRFVVSYITLLWTSYDSVDRIVRVKSGTNSLLHPSPLTNQIREVVSSLEAKLARESETFPDDSLRFLFLINNSYFLHQELHTIWLLCGVTSKIEEYIQSYLQVSWSPVLKCLYNPPFHCFTRYSPLAKFESKFQKTYSAQKLWKVPDPELRRRLRKSIIHKVTSAYTKFLQDNSISTPRITPQDMEDMLQEIFEG